MSTTIKVLAISGSTRQHSANSSIIKAITRLSEGLFDIQIYEGLATLAHFNPDHLNNVPAEVSDFKAQLHHADAVLICTPEYAAGVPGVLKNAIDWTVSSMEFARKPVALITAGTSGKIAHRSLLDTLLLIEAKITAETQLVISSVRTKLGADNTITDPETLAKVQALIRELKVAVSGDGTQVFLTPPEILPG